MYDDVDVACKGGSGSSLINSLACLRKTCSAGQQKLWLSLGACEDGGLSRNRVMKIRKQLSSQAELFTHTPFAASHVDLLPQKTSLHEVQAG